MLDKPENHVEHIDVADRGKTIRIPSVVVDGRRVTVKGRLVKLAGILDEEFVEGELVNDAPSFIGKVLKKGLRPDIFMFPQKIYEPTPKYPYTFDLDNAAVACTTSCDDWWSKLPQESRKNARRAAKRGVVVESVNLDDHLISGIKEIYDETPFRQGKRFWHYGKNLTTIKNENGSYLKRSEFIGAYYGDELIGFMKFVYVDQVAHIMQILSKASHYDKRPMNALITKAVEVCQKRGISYLVYGKFTYGNKDKSQLSEFKRRNGFVRIDFPRYFIPLTMKGRVFLGLRLQRGVFGILPSNLIDVICRARAGLLRARRWA
jgi:hypothetical protein